MFQDSYRHWKTWKNETTFSSQGKVGEFLKKNKSQGISSESGKTMVHKLKLNTITQ